MENKFNTRFTHALLIGIMVLVTNQNPHPVIGGEIGQMLHAPILIGICAGWAYYLAKRS